MQRLDVVEELRVGAPLYGGRFLAWPVGAPEHAEARELPFTLPGELVRRGGTASADLTVLETSAARVTPGCVHFGVCGGCHYQHASYPEQAAIKLKILADLFARGGVALPAAGLHTREPWGYRNRIRLRVEKVEGVSRLGYSARGSNQFLPVTMCPIAAPLLWRAAEALLALGSGAYARWFDQVAQVELFTTGDESRVQASFLLRDAGIARNEPRLFAALCEVLRERVPQLAGAEAALDPELSRRARRAWEGASWGAPGLNYSVGARAYWVSRGSFFQVNRWLVGQLVELVTGDLRGELAWDLFAGVGLFSRPLLERFSRLVAVEAGESAASDLAQVGRSARRDQQFSAVRATTIEFLRARQHQRERPDAVVLDPPRAGLGPEAAVLLAEVRPPTIVYVSCDPETLVRDLAVLVRAGYTLRAVDLIDLFPQTFHLETVVRLERS